MTSTTELPDPFKIVAEALGCPRASLSMDSAMYRDHGWDSFGHLRVIKALEAAYGISIDNDTIEKYVTMRIIEQLHEEIIRGGDRNDA